MLKCLKKREGPGRAYVYAPKKRPDVAIRMIQQLRAEETFAPVIDSLSDTLSQRRSGRGQLHHPQQSQQQHHQQKQEVSVVGSASASTGAWSCCCILLCGVVF